MAITRLAEIVRSSFTSSGRVNHAAGYLCRVAILTPLQESYLLEKRIISFDRAETNLDKVG